MLQALPHPRATPPVRSGCQNHRGLREITVAKDPQVHPPKVACASRDNTMQKAAIGLNADESAIMAATIATSGPCYVTQILAKFSKQLK